MEIVSAYRFHRQRSQYLSSGAVVPMPATAALEAARRDVETKTARYPRSADSMLLGAADKDGLRWIDEPSRIGLRFVGWADDLRAADHYGWWTDPEGMGETYRGCVYQLPARNGCPQYVAGYREGSYSHRQRQWTDTNGDSARLDVGTIWQGGKGGERDSELRAAAYESDRLAKRDAEQDAEYQSAWQDGSKAADLAETIAAESAVARALVRDIKAKRGELAGPICDALKGAVRRHRDTIAKARRERRELLDNYEGTRNGWRSHLWEAFAEGAGL